MNALSKMTMVVAILAMVLIPVSAMASTWVGTGGGGDGSSWSDPNNWSSPVGVPTSADGVTINLNGANVTLTGGSGTPAANIQIAASGSNTSTLNFTSSTLDMNNGNFNIGHDAGGNGTWNITSSTVTNFGGSADNSYLDRNGGGTATLTLDGSSVTATSGLILTLNGNSTITAKNSSTLDLSASGQITMQAGTSGVLNVDSTSKMILGGSSGGGIGAINGTGGYTYTLPLGNWANVAAGTGKIYSYDGISGVGNATGTNVVVDIDSTLAPVGGFVQAADTTLDWHNGTIAIGDNGGDGTLYVKDVTINNFGGASNNSWINRGSGGGVGGTSSLILDGATINGTDTLSLGLNRSGANNSSATITVKNGSDLNLGARGVITTGGGGGAGANSVAYFNVDATSKIIVGNASGGGTISLNGSAGNSAAVYDMPMGNWANEATGTGKIYAYYGINQIATASGNIVTVNLDSTLAPSGGYVLASDTSLNANQSGLNIGQNGGTGQLNLTSVSYTNLNEVENGRSGGSGTISLTNSTLGVSNAGFYNGYDTNTSTKSQLIMNNGQVSITSGNFFNRNATTSASTMGSQITGTGTINFTNGGTFRNNGRVVADGGLLSITGGTVTSTLTSASQVSTGFYGQNGWYATSGSGASELTLPGLASFSGSKTWGETSTDTAPLLVNAVTFHNVSGLTGTLNGSLLATDYSTVPAGLIDPIGVWDFSDTNPDPGLSAEMEIRYDDALADSLAIDQTQLKLFHYTDGAWVDITNGAVDTVNKRIDSIAFTSFSPFAVALGVEAPSVPEPSTYALALAAIAGLGLIAWRRRRA